MGDSPGKTADGLYSGDKNIIQAVQQFVKQKKRFEAQQEAYDERKKEFNELMQECFDGTLNAGGKSLKFPGALDDEVITVTKTERTEIEWDVEKLLSRIPVEYRKQVYSKKYEVIDMPGLIAYLKTCGVKPSIFKQFLEITEVFNAEALDSLPISTDRIRGCYTVHMKPPVFRVTVKKAKNS